MTSHANYAAKKGYGFPILADPGEKTIAAFKSQKPTGKGVLRTVYAVNRKGKIIFAERGQAGYEDVLAAIRNAE